MKLPLIIFLLILASIVFVRWRQSQDLKEQKKTKAKPEEKKEGGGEKEDGEKKQKIAEIIKISAAGAIFLILLYALIPGFIAKYHKEIIILVVAMIAGSALLGISQDWEKNSTRKILKTHFVILSIILISIVLYKELEIGEWIKEKPPQPQATEVMPVWKYTLKPGEKIYTEVFIGQGVNLRFQSSEQFYVVAGQMDGTTKKYLMPNGKSVWIGGAPRGPLTLEGITETKIYIRK